MRAVGLAWERVDVGDGRDTSRVAQMVARGFRLIVLYNPGLAGRSPARCATEVRALARKVLPLGVTEIEFGNEVYYNGRTPQSYAAQYAAAHNALKGLRITLLANAFGDYRRPDGTWSQDASGGGWIHDFIAALPQKGREIDAFSMHPYGPMDRLGLGEDGGWPAVARYHDLAVAAGVDVPWYVTEVGQNLGGAHLTAGQFLGQAADVLQYLTDVLRKYTYVRYLGLYALKDDVTGRWGLLDANDAPRPSFRALAGWMHTHRYERVALSTRRS